MGTFEDVLDLGLYTSDCCNEELIFDTGDTFCRCPRCESLCSWELESRITPIDSLETGVTTVATDHEVDRDRLGAKQVNHSELAPAPIAIF